MKMLTLILCTGFVGSLLAATQATTLEFKLTGIIYNKTGTNWKNIALSDLNPKLKAKGLPEFPERVEVGSKNAEELSTKLNEQFDKAKEVLKLRASMLLDQGIYLHDLEDACYKGSPDKVVPLIRDLDGVVFGEDMGIQAVKYGDKKVVFDKDYFFETTKDEEVREQKYSDFPGLIELWKNYDKKTDTVLLMSDLGPQGDGTELYGTEIPRCK